MYILLGKEIETSIDTHISTNSSWRFKVNKHFLTEVPGVAVNFQ